MIRTIALNKLVSSPRNVRRCQDSRADDELKASIATHGLLQNLLVRAGAKGRFEVEAGERRRRAMVALADEKLLARDHPVTCLVLEENGHFDASLAENFHRLAMNPADEAQAFAALVTHGLDAEDIARRFGLTVRFVEGRLRLAALAPVVFEALAAGRINLDMAKAYGATSDHSIQARVFEQLSSAYYAPNADSIRRMVLDGTVRGSDPRARLVGPEAYIAAGGRIERELFDDEASEAWLDTALLESLAMARMEREAAQIAADRGLAWVRPTLDAYASHALVEGLVRLPAEPSPLTDEEVARLEVLDASYDEHAAILEDEDSAHEAVAAAERALAQIERETQDIRNRPPVLGQEHKGKAGMVIVLGRDGTPVLQPVFYGKAERPDDAAGEGEQGKDSDRRPAGRSDLSRRLLDELAMQRRDILSLHVASDPALALDIMVFVLADADTRDWQAKTGTTLRGGSPSGPLPGFEPTDAAASVALGRLRNELDDSWRTGETMTQRFDLFRSLSDEERAGWLGFVVARSLEASLNLAGERRVGFHDHLGTLIGIDTAAWWRPTAANFFDRVPKSVILDALAHVGGPELSVRYASAKKADLATSAERIFAGATIAEAQERERALAWVPEAMRFAAPVPAVLPDAHAEADPDAQVDSIEDQEADAHENSRDLAA